MKLLFVTGSRGEWGHIRPILKICKETNIDYEILATTCIYFPNMEIPLKKLFQMYRSQVQIHSTYDGANHLL